MKKVFTMLLSMLKVFYYKKKLEPYLDLIFASIDKRAPSMFGNVDGSEFKELIARSINRATGSAASDPEIQAIVELYSPIIAAAKLFESSGR